MRVVFRPLPSWPGQPASHRTSPFSSTWPQTIALLQREAGSLWVAEIVIEVGLTERDIRTDGWPRGNARATHPGVAISLESKQGPLRFATNTFWHWQDNVRAIALGLEALRRVDRYGSTRSGEQYRGWRALPAGNGHTDVRAAAELIARAAGFIKDHSVTAILDGPGLQSAYRVAARRLHPDAGGSAQDFARLQAAKRVLDEARS